jgi:hypothetical protein
MGLQISPKTRTTITTSAITTRDCVDGFIAIFKLSKPGVICKCVAFCECLNDFGVLAQNGAAQIESGMGRRPKAYSTSSGKCFCINVE